MAGPHPPNPVRRLDIEGLRGLAVLLVVGFHAGLSAFSGAFVAVDVFFALSGFFLTTSLMRQVVADDRIDLATVYARRVWRLLPMLVVVVLATLATVMLLYAPIDRAAAADLVAPAIFFASNISFAAGGVNYFSAGENPLLHTWTLGVEYQLVILFPALVVAFAAMGRSRARDETGEARRVTIMHTVFSGIAMTGAISFMLSVWISESSPMWAYFGPHTRLWAFCAGAGMAFFAGGAQSIVGTSPWRIGFAQLAGLAAILVPAWFYDRTMPYPGTIALVPVGGTLLLLAGGARASETLVGRALGSRPLAWLGRVSYAWYLWHWPLMVLGGVLVPEIGAFGRLACGLAALPLASLTTRLVEERAGEPIRARVMPNNPLLWAAGMSAIVAVIAALASTASDRFVTNSVHRTFAAARSGRVKHDCWVRSVDDGPKTSCAFGDAASTTTLALLGDSHAEHWLGGLDRAGREYGWRVEANVMGGCPVADFSGLTSSGLSRKYGECTRYREAMLAKIVAQKPRAVILSSFDYYVELKGAERHDYQVSEEAWIVGLRRTYSRLSGAGIPVIVIRGTPKVPFDVPSCLSRRAAQLPFATDCTYTLDRDFMARARRAQDLAALGLNVRFVDMNDLVCASDPCETMRGGVVLYGDDNHLTASFTRSVGSLLGARVAAAMNGLTPTAWDAATGLLRKHGPRWLIEKAIGRVLPGM